MGLLVAGFDFSAVAADEFNDWYDTEHIPERRGVPEFINAERWLGADDPRVSIATYDLQSLDVLRSAPYLAIAHDSLSPWSKRVIARCRRLCRFEAEQLAPGNVVAPAAARGLLLTAMNVDAAIEPGFDAWYRTEHLPRLAQVPGCLAARWFRIVSGVQRRVALYHLTDPEVAASVAWEQAGNAPRAREFLRHVSGRLHLLLRRYSRASPAAS
jgi:hypothetical protein